MSTERTTRFMFIALSAVCFGGGGVPVLITLLLRIGDKTTHALDQFGQTLFWVFLFTALPSVLLSLSGAIWLAIIARRCSSIVRLIGHGLITGAVLAIPFVMFVVVVDSTRTPLSMRALMLFLGIGALSGATYAGLFHSVLLPSRLDLAPHTG